MVTNFPIIHSQIIAPTDTTQAYTVRLRNSDKCEKKSLQINRSGSISLSIQYDWFP